MIFCQNLGALISLGSFGDGFSLAACNLKLVTSSDDSSGSAQMAQRWHYGSHPLQLRQFSGIERASRRHKMSIQRHQPGLPPDISAGNVQIVRKMQ